MRGWIQAAEWSQSLLEPEGCFGFLTAVSSPLWESDEQRSPLCLAAGSVTRLREGLRNQGVFG